MKKPAILLLLAFALASSSCNRITEAEAPPPPDGRATVAIRISTDSLHWSDSTWREGGTAPVVERKHKAWFQIVLEGDYDEADSLVVRWGDDKRTTLTRGRVLGHAWADTGTTEITAAVWIDGYQLADTAFPIRIINHPPRPGLRDAFGSRTSWSIDSVLTYLRPAATEGTEKTFFDFDFDGKTPTWDDTVAAGEKASWKWSIPVGADTSRSVRIVERVVDDLGAEASDTITLALRAAPPRVALRAAADTVRLGDSLRVTAHATAPRGLDSLAWSIDGTNRTTSGVDSVLVVRATRPGAIVIAARAIDVKGVRSAADTILVHVRGTHAIASILGPDSTFLGDTIRLHAKAAADAPAGITWTWKIGGQVVGTGDAFSGAFHKPETVHVTAIASTPDLPPDSMVHTLAIIDRAPVVDSVTGVRAILEGQTTRLCAWAHDPDRDSIAWRWFLAGSSQVVSSSACFDFAPADTGSFDLLVEAGDPWGKTGSKSVRIEVGASRLAVDAGVDISLNYGIALSRLGSIATNLDTASLSVQWTVVTPHAKQLGGRDTIRVAGRVLPDSLFRRLPGLYEIAFEARSDSLGIRASDTAKITVVNRPLIATIALLDPADTVLAQDDTVRLVVRVVDPDSALEGADFEGGVHSKGNIYWKWVDENGGMHYEIWQDGTPPLITSGTLIDTLLWRLDSLKTIGKVAFTAHVWDRFYDLGTGEANAELYVEPKVGITIADSMPRIDLWDPNPVIAETLQTFRSCFVPPPGRTLIDHRWSLDDSTWTSTKEYVPLTTSVASGSHVLRIAVIDDAGNSAIDSIAFVASQRMDLPDASTHEPIDRFQAQHLFDTWESICRPEWRIDRPLGYIKVSARHARGGTVQTGIDGNSGAPLIFQTSVCQSGIVAVFRPDSGAYDMDSSRPAAGFYLVVDNGVLVDSVWMALPIRYLPSPPVITVTAPAPDSIVEGEEFALGLVVAPPAAPPGSTDWELRIGNLPANTRIRGSLATGYPWMITNSATNPFCAGPTCILPSSMVTHPLRIDLDTNFNGDLTIPFHAVAFEMHGDSRLESPPAKYELRVHVEAVASDPSIIFSSVGGYYEIPYHADTGKTTFAVTTSSDGMLPPTEVLDTLLIACSNVPAGCPASFILLDPATRKELPRAPDGRWVYIPSDATLGTGQGFLAVHRYRLGAVEVDLDLTAVVREPSNGTTNRSSATMHIKFAARLFVNQDGWSAGHDRS